LAPLRETSNHQDTEELLMKTVGVLLVSCALALVPAQYSGAQTAGSTTLGVAVEELKVVAVGWSVKKQILGKTVYNENNQKVGRIDDLIVAPDSAVSFAIIGAGGFVGLGRHDVAIPVQQIKLQDAKFILPGATKQAIKALPKFEYAKK
jgi:sporulation protein YlmC with PRC-barrel domain